MKYEIKEENKIKFLIISLLVSLILGVLIGVLGVCLIYDVNVKRAVKIQEIESNVTLKEEESTLEDEVDLEEEKIDENDALEQSNIVEGAMGEFGIALAQYNIKESKVKRNQFFANLLSDYGVPQNQIYNISQKCKGIFDLRKFKVGNHYSAYVSKETHELDYLVYEQDSQSYAFFTFKDTLQVKIIQKQMCRTMKYVEVTIKNSLWSDVVDAGASPLLALKLADIYAWTIDFFGLQPGDSFKALYEELSYHGEVLDISKIQYADFIHLDESNYAYYFEEEGLESNVYWNEKGESLRKAFLKAPLSFTRISSGFSYNRRHPITRKVMPHTGIDYAAPRGTPVMSIGDGVVIDKGYKGPNGNLVKIRHNSTYISAYIHLSKYGKGIKKGARVKQGQIIGYVGSTGRSIGPHLDFRIWKNGTPINPLKMKSPPARPIKSDNMPEFEKSKTESLDMITSTQALEFWRETVVGQVF